MCLLQMLCGLETTANVTANVMWSRDWVKQNIVNQQNLEKSVIILLLLLSSGVLHYYSNLEMRNFQKLDILAI